MGSATNKVVLSGFAGADAEVKKLSGNLKLARVNLAVNESYKNSSGEEVKKTQWFTLIFWNAKADLAETQIKKGTNITVEGRLQCGSYSAKDGSKRLTTEIVVNEITFKVPEIAN
ncbi:single-stranded DNA-binding protein [Pedobacter punctiformis]|uniref:Single-stranded DNA-binding protein n=1 Tax=Pedobacter punctiformis TaxID=3004097 RepID=A0ABT4L9Q7_9SPHI|nr:single-stranded DNA-binding protein [Pedobacter sp. HCMS5-2]MCZ4244630.1 single-stranded DNA-binding protein [Pedobacter sp. HCMS5-2]